MATTTGTVVFYDEFSLTKNNGAIDLATIANMGCLLTTSAYVPNVATHLDVADITNEVTGNGYVRDTTLSPVFSEPSGGTRRLDISDPTFTASGGSIVARYLVIYDNTNGTDATRELICHGLLDDTPADVTTTDGNTLTIQVNASGLFEEALVDA